jgi:hypothetical protein
MKLFAKEDKNTKKCQKESKKRICTRYALHRGHDDSRRATMGTDLAPKESERIFVKIEPNLLHRGTMRSILATMEAKPIMKNYK